jgi:hypothetical protein
MTRRLTAALIAAALLPSGSILIRGASPLGLPDGVARSPLRRSLRSAGSLATLARAAQKQTFSSRTLGVRVDVLVTDGRSR